MTSQRSAVLRGLCSGAEAVLREGAWGFFFPIKSSGSCLTLFFCSGSIKVGSLITPSPPPSITWLSSAAPWNSTRKCVQRCTVHSTLLLLKKHLYYILSPVSFIREFLCVTRKYWVTHFISLMILWPINTCRGLMRSCYDC